MGKRLLNIVTIVMLLATMFSFNVFASGVTTLNDIDDKSLGDKVTITGTNTIEGATLQVKRPNGTTLYLDVLNQGSFTDTFTLPTDAMIGMYTVIAGKGTDYVTKTFNVLNESVIKKEISKVEVLSDITVAYGTNFYDLPLPTEVEILLDDNTTAKLAIKWNSEGYNKNLPGQYTLNGELVLVGNITNSNDLKASIKVIVRSRSNNSSSSEPKPTEPKIESDKDGNIKVVVSTKSPLDSKTLEKAFKEAKQGEDGIKKLAIEVPEVKEAKQYTVEIPSDFISSTIADKKIVLETTIASVTLQNNMFKSSQVKGKDKIGFSIGIGDKSELNQEVKDKIGDRPIITINAKSGNEIVPWNNPDVPVMVTIDYMPNAEELKDPEHIVVWYIDGEGKVIPVPNGKYDVTTGTVTFTTTHFSKYAVSFVRKTFDDISDVTWAKNEIEVMASKGVINGTSETTYSPNANISRADFMCLLIRTLELNAEIDSNFDDVKPTDYYYEALGVAKKLGITTGVGNNKFNPKEEIARQDMMVLLARALKMVDKISVTGTAEDISEFNDAAKVSDYAVEGVASLKKEGIIKGSGNMIEPQGKATRAETAVMMYRVLNK